MTQTALITGASTGIGRLLAQLAAADGKDVVLAARSTDKLEALAAELSAAHGNAAHVLPADLSAAGAARELAETVKRKGWTIDILINNAGFGYLTDFATSDLDTTTEMMQLNVISLTVLMRLFLEDMVKRGRGHILNVASMAGFEPGPNMAVYYATKAFVLSLSEAVHQELRGTGVTLTTLCPGPTITEFHERAGLTDAPLFARMFAQQAEPVARAGYNGMKKGKAIVIPGVMNRLTIQALRISPRALVRRAVQKLQPL